MHACTNTLMTMSLLFVLPQAATSSDVASEWGHAYELKLQDELAEAWMHANTKV
jgi:hypothetical protein